MRKTETSPMLVLFRKELGNAMRPTYWASCLFMGGLMVWIYVFSPIESIQTMTQASPQIASYMATSYAQMFAILQPAWLFLLTWMYLATEAFTLEKNDGRLEMLLTTPLRLHEVLAGKCLALLVLIYPYVLLVTGLVFGLQDAIWPTRLGVAPGINSQVLLISLFAGPLLAFGVGALLGLLTLRVNNANTIQSLSFIVTFAVGFGGSYGLIALQKQAMNNLSDLITWPVIGVYLALALALWLVVWLLLRGLNKDHVVQKMA
ncbi:MAG: ABC-2 transporter permease [Anaerolineaceae bacterium]|nr:ABC-2 transporter permease [Anaerolineaceae bacterium]